MNQMSQGKNNLHLDSSAKEAVDLFQLANQNIVAALLDLIGVNYTLLDTEGNYIAYNDAVLSWFPGSSKKAGEIDPPSWEDCKQVMKNGEKTTKEEWFNGRCFLSVKYPLMKNGESLGLIVLSIEITQQKKTERELLETQHKLDGMTLVSSSVAHELRTPLASLNMDVDFIKEALPKLIHAYRLAKEANLPVETIRKSEIDALEKSIYSMHNEIGASFAFINMLLLNLNPVANVSQVQLFSINQCISDAIQRYPFSGNQKDLILWKENKANDFLVKGELLLVIHVLFNLIKNALYYVAKAGKGNIEIWPEKGELYNRIYFKDTGTGIPPEILPAIFKRFYSQTYHGAGVGLTFCEWVMQNLGGKITCESVLGDYTLFVMSFPVIQ